MKKTLLLCLILSQMGYASETYAIYDTLQVVHNNLYFDIRDFKQETLYGRADITVRSKQDGLKYAPLLLLGMQIDSVLVDGERIIHYQYNDTLLRIPAASLVKKGGEALLTVAYHGKPVASSFGGFLFNNDLQMAHNMGASLEAVPHSFGRGWFPATDDFRSRSTFDLYFCVDKGLKAIGSGILKDTIPHANGTTTWHWSVNQPIPDYLVSVAVGNYEKIHMEHQQSSRILPIDIYVLPNEVEEAKEAYSILPDVLDIMEKHFGEYAFDRVGYVSVNNPGGAMEHVGNISMPMNPSASFGYQMLVIHELIHGWFGNQVTCATAEDMWLNEGITTFCPEIVLSELFSANTAMRYAKKSQELVLQYAPKQEKGHYALAHMPQSCTYGISTYHKGAAVMHTLCNYLGAERLIPALRDYVKEYSFRHATTNDFKNFVTAHTGTDLTDFFDLWVNQPGYPAFEIDSITGTLGEEGYEGVLHIEQKRWHAPQYGRNVRVPVTLYDQEGKDSRKVYVSVSGATSACPVTLPFEPAYGLVDADYEIATASYLEKMELDSVKTYTSKPCLVELECKSVSEPLSVVIQFYGVAPDALKGETSVQLSDTHYWRLAGDIPSSCDISARFMLDKNIWDAALLSGKESEVRIMYRATQSDEWSEFAICPLGEDSFVVADKVQAGEYCLAVRK